MPRLKTLYCDIEWRRDEPIIRQLGRLETINDRRPDDLIRKLVSRR